MTRRLKSIPVLAAVAVAMLGLAVTSAAPARAGTTYSAARCPGPALGKNVPVLLVHGLNAGPGMWTEGGAHSMTAAISVIPGVKVVAPFDYQAVHTDWVVNPLIGPALAARITGLAAASKCQGGPGKVIIVAHSMGGLAVRCAVDPVCAGKAAANPDLLGLVITLDTPNLGTFAGVVPDGRWLCYSVPGCPNWLGLPLSLAKTQAGQALDPGSAYLSQLPLLPASVPVHAFAGKITLTTSLFGIGPFDIASASAGDVGDVAVPVVSALAEMPTCTPPSPLPDSGYTCPGTSLHGGPGSGSTIENCGTIPLANLTAWATVSAATRAPVLRCWHLTEVTNPVWQAGVVATIKAASAAMAGAPCTAAALTSAIAAGPQANLAPGWSVSSYACDSGYALADVNVPVGYGSLVAILRQNGPSWMVIYGPTEGFCIDSGEYCPNPLPWPKSILAVLKRQMRT